ncbi:MAG: CDP-diacylglycerol--glycerol-3-phosphate 3-phosphatidyltransferase [Elusimicrobiota bacterium]
MTLANKITLGRLALALVTFGCLWVQRPALYVAALALYLLATATDWIDGWLARRTHSVSPFGAMADPVADKVLVIGALIAFVRIPHLDVPTWAVFLIIVRELVITALRALAGLQGLMIPADRGGKLKMAIQSAAVLIILGILVARGYRLIPAWTWLDAIPYYLVVLSMLVSVLSGIQYIRNARHVLRATWNAPRRKRR